MDTILLSVTSKMLNLRLFIFHATVNDSKNNSVNPSWCAGTFNSFDILWLAPEEKRCCAHLFSDQSYGWERGNGSSEVKVSEWEKCDVIQTSSSYSNVKLEPEFGQLMM